MTQSVIAAAEAHAGRAVAIEQVAWGVLKASPVELSAAEATPSSSMASPSTSVPQALASRSANDDIAAKPWIR
jgi:hypothetical protein